MRKIIAAILISVGCVVSLVSFDQARGAGIQVHAHPIGAFICSRDTETQFQREMGAGWVLYDGRNVAGSKWASKYGTNTLDDMRGAFVRMKNNGRSDGKENSYGDLALGTYSYDAPGDHSHIWLTFTLYDSGTKYRQQTFKQQGVIQDFQPAATATNDTQNRGYIATQSDVGTVTNQLRGFQVDHGYTGWPVAGSDAHAINTTGASNRGDTETSVRNLTMNCFVRIN